MQKCKLCEKPVYGHPITSQILVCGSCSLTRLPKEENDKEDKNLFQVRLDLANAVTQVTKVDKPVSMSYLKIKSNFARNRTILLSNNYPLDFDETGIATCPTHMLAVVQFLQSRQPGRFQILETIIEEIPVIAVVEEISSHTDEKQVEEKFYNIDQSFLKDLDSQPKKGRGRPKKIKVMEDSNG